MESDEAVVREAIRRQNEDPEDHDLSLIDQCLSLTPEERLRKLSAWMNLVRELRKGAPISSP